MPSQSTDANATLQFQYRVRYSYLLFEKFLSTASPSIARPALWRFLRAYAYAEPTEISHASRARSCFCGKRGIGDSRNACRWSCGSAQFHLGDVLAASGPPICKVRLCGSFCRSTVLPDVTVLDPKPAQLQLSYADVLPPCVSLVKTANVGRGTVSSNLCPSRLPSATSVGPVPVDLPIPWVTAVAQWDQFCQGFTFSSPSAT